MNYALKSSGKCKNIDKITFFVQFNEAHRSNTWQNINIDRINYFLKFSENLPGQKWITVQKVVECKNNDKITLFVQVNVTKKSNLQGKI